MMLNRAKEFLKSAASKAPGNSADVLLVTWLVGLHFIGVWCVSLCGVYIFLAWGEDLQVDFCCSLSTAPKIEIGNQSLISDSIGYNIFV